MNSLFIKNAFILDSPPSESNATSLIVQNGRIRQIGRDLSSGDHFPVFDAEGLILMPGWMDIQLNGSFGRDFTENPASIWGAAEELPKLGVTSFLPTIITSPLLVIDKAIQTIKDGPPDGFRGSKALGLHIEGPFLNPGKKGAHNPNYLLLPSPELVQHWTRSNGVLLVTMAPEIDPNFQTIHALRELGVVVSAGHSLATFEQANQSFLNGVQCGTHLFNAQPTMEHRNPGLSIALLNAPDVFAGLIVDGIHSHPAMVKMAWAYKGSRRLIIVTDAISALGMPSGNYNLGGNKIIVTDTKVTLPDGTLAGSIVTIQQSLRNLMKWTGCTLYEAVRTVTANPAELLNLPNKGRIVVGADADFVLTDPNLEIKATIIGGEVLYKGY